MGMRKKPIQKPMIGNVSKPKPTTPAPQESNKAGGLGESIADQVSSGKLDKRTLPMLPPSETNRLLPGGGLVPNTSTQRGNKLLNALREAPLPPQSANPPMGEIAASRGISDKPSFKDKLSLPQQPNPIEDAIKAQLGDRYSDYQKARSELNSRMQTMDLRKDPITGQMTSSTDIGNREQLFKQFGIDAGALPKPALPPTGNQPRNISPALQVQQDQQRMYQTQPASQQMQAPEAEPIQPASQQMQSEQQAPEQDNSAIDSQIAQLQQQIAQLQAQKK